MTEKQAMLKSMSEPAKVAPLSHTPKTSGILCRRGPLGEMCYKCRTLIYTAPELLDAAKNFVWGGNHIVLAHRQRLLDAIAKAEEK